MWAAVLLLVIVLPAGSWVFFDSRQLGRFFHMDMAL
jgi:hypothetical protein